jgi:hypothetical protein
MMREREREKGEREMREGGKEGGGGGGERDLACPTFTVPKTPQCIRQPRDEEGFIQSNKPSFNIHCGG